MLWYLNGYPTANGDVYWATCIENSFERFDGLCISINFSSFNNPKMRGDAVRYLKNYARNFAADWICESDYKWQVDVNALKEKISALSIGFPDFEWLRGLVQEDFEFDVQSTELHGSHVTKKFDAYLRMLITKESYNAMLHLRHTTPTELRESVRKFKLDYPDPQTVGFLMMQFGQTRAHENIMQGVRNAFGQKGIPVVRADDKQYHNDLFPNVQTYLHGCSFAIAVFERLEDDDFNPNVSLEVGYMIALGKPVCLLKDRTLRTLQTDLVGKIYLQFDPQNPANSVQDPVLKWAKDNGILRE